MIKGGASLSRDEKATDFSGCLVAACSVPARALVVTGTIVLRQAYLATALVSHRGCAHALSSTLVEKSHLLVQRHPDLHTNIGSADTCHLACCK